MASKIYDVINHITTNIKMILSDKDIKRYVSDGRIVVRPEPEWEKALGSCVVDLRLGGIEGRSKLRHYKLRPQEFVLAVTLEYLELPDDLCGTLHGRSSIGRCGVMVHSTAAMIEAGFRGKIVLELFNAGRELVELACGQRVCAISFEQLTSLSARPYYKKPGAKYVGQKYAKK